MAGNVVTAIHQDKDGFMWFGTHNGLSRYNGIDLKNFQLPNKRLYIGSIDESPDGKLWTLSYDSILCFDRHAESFIPIIYDSPSATTSFLKIQIINDSTLIALSEDNLFRISVRQKGVNENKTLVLKEDKKYKNTFSKSKIIQVCLSANLKDIYLLTDDLRLIRMDMATERVVSECKVPHNFSSSEITSFSCIGEYVWITVVRKGVILYHMQTQRFDQFAYDTDSAKSCLPHTDGYSVSAVNDGSYVVTTWNGFAFISPNRSLRPRIYSNTSFPQDLNMETRMLSSFYDSSGNLWVGTRGGGVFYVNLKRYYKRYHYHQHNAIHAQVSDEDNYVWLATFHGGIMKSNTPFYSTALETLSFTTVEGTDKSAVLCATKDRDKNLWFGDFNGRLLCYDWKTKRLQSYTMTVGSTIFNLKIISLYIDSRNRFWVGTYKGLFLFDRSTGYGKRVVLFSDSTSDDAIKGICEDKDQNIWLATYRGVVQIKGGNTADMEIVKGYELEAKIASRRAYSILAATDGRVYIGYSSGFAVVAGKEPKIVEYYTINDGLCNDEIMCLTQDASGQIWLGSTSGVSRYSAKQKLFYNNYISGSNYSAMLLDSTLFWGNNRCLTYFDPQKKNQLHEDRKVVLAKLVVNHKVIDMGDKENGQTILQSNISFTDHLRLNNDNRDFSLFFNNLNYSNDIQKYAYRLYPYQKEWITTEISSATFTNLPPGDYSFEVKAVYPDRADAPVTTLKITILPHWSETILFRSFLIVGFIALLCWVIMRINRRHKQVRRSLILEHKLELAHLERNKEKALREEKECFFTNAAHELRTPLTLILSPLQGLLKSVPKEDASYSSLAIMHRNCSSLSTLVDRLLFVQKIEIGMVKLHLAEWDVVDLVQKQVEYFKQMALMRECKLIVHKEVESFNLWVDVQLIESAISNLLTNAFKYTSSKGCVTVTLSQKKIDNIPFFLISIADTGIGISEEQREHLYEPFVVSNNSPHFSSSMGIGLYIVKHTMDLHHGKIVLESEEGKGSCFTLCIPEGRSHFEADNCKYVDNSKERKQPEPISWTVPLEVEVADMQSKTGSDRPTILIIEDNEEMRSYICTLFKSTYNVIEAENGSEGVNMTKEYLPQLVISDVMMPVMDGIEYCKTIRAEVKTSRIPIILLTAKSEDQDKINALRMGVDDYIMKPFNPEILCEKVKSLLVQREYFKRLYTQTLMLKPSITNEDDVNKLFLKKVQQVIEENLSDPKFGVQELAKHLNMSQPTLYRRIKKCTDLSILEVIVGVKMAVAASLIMHRKYSMQEISEKVGFDSINTFRKHFVAQFGTLPSKYDLERNNNADTKQEDTAS